MKFNKQLSNGGLFLPSAALKISGFEDSGQVEIHALKNTAVIMKQQMTAMELIQALDSLNQLFIMAKDLMYSPQISSLLCRKLILGR